jgi:hypothetical protein
MNRARTALSNATSILSARQANQVTDGPQQRHFRICLNRIIFVVDLERNGSHTKVFYKLKLHF